MRFKRKHRILMLISAIFVFLSVWLLSIDPKNDASAWWNADLWINNSFWEQNPSNWNIITALFGNWYPWSSPYNRYWTWFCLPNKITYVQNIAQIQNMVRDTIYVIEPGVYNISTPIMPGNCSAIVWKWTWETTFVVGNNIAFDITDKHDVILDNINISGNNLTWISLKNSNYNTFHNIEIYNASLWFNLYNSSYNRLNRIKSHNSDKWISIYQWTFNFVSNSELYNNNKWLELMSQNNISNNNQIYNNEIWIDISNWNHNSINNDQIYNNTNWITVSSTRNLVNNSNVYSNENWIVISNSKELLVMSGNIYNNNLWIGWNGTVRYYNTVWLFANTTNSNGVNLIKWGYEAEANYNVNTDLLTLLHPGVWELKTDLNMNRFLRTYPVDKYGIKFIHPLAWFTRWRLNWIPKWPIKYIAWKQIIKQTNPLRFEILGSYNWAMLTQEHNNKYFIASIDSERSEFDDSIVNYYYGDYWQDSEFTKNWNEKNCNINVMTVEFVNDQNDFFSKLLGPNMPLGHTIYVLMSGTYNVTDTIKVTNDCVAIVWYKWDNVNLDYYPGINWHNPVIKIDGYENEILDWLAINGRKNSSDNIIFERNGEIASVNNTVNNIQSFKSLWDGINVWSLAKYHTIMNSQFWNNEWYGIEIYQWWENNIINNSLSYNNGLYGIWFGNKSKFNSINNSQFFNNGIWWIFSDLNTQSNIINNVSTYNNTDYGINLKWSSWNVLSNVSVFNNNIGINIEDDSSINNVYIFNLLLFGNNWWDLVWTNWNDKFLHPSTFTIEWLLDVDYEDVINNENESVNEANSIDVVDVSTQNSSSSTILRSTCSADQLVACGIGTVNEIQTCVNNCIEWDWTELVRCIANDAINYQSCIDRYVNNTQSNSVNLSSYSIQGQNNESSSDISSFDNEDEYITSGININNEWDSLKWIQDIISGSYFNDWTDSYDCMNFTVVRNADFTTWKRSWDLEEAWYDTACSNSGFTWNSENYCCDASIAEQWDTGDDEWGEWDGENIEIDYSITPICSWSVNYTDNCTNSGWQWDSIHFCCNSGDTIDGTFMCENILKLTTWAYMDSTAQHYTLNNDGTISLDDNTIFVFNSWENMVDYPIIMWKCSAILWWDGVAIKMWSGVNDLFTFGEASQYAVLSHINIMTEDLLTKKLLVFSWDNEPYTIAENVSVNWIILTDTLSDYVNWNISVNTWYIKFLYTVEDNQWWDDEVSVKYGQMISGWPISCQDVTTPQDLSIDNSIFYGLGNCGQKWIISNWDANLDTIPVKYIFGSNVKKQIAPIWYIGYTMTILDNQYIKTSYIWEINPIVYTDPGVISFNWANRDWILTWINYEIGVNFSNQWLLNHNFDMYLTFTNSEDIDGHLEIMTNWQWQNIWTGSDNIDYKSVEKIRIIIKAPDDYLHEIEWSLYIGTPEYGNSTEIFWLQTMAEPIAPTIRWLKNINNWWVWADSDNIWQVKTDWKYGVSTRYDYVDKPNDCNSGINMNSYTQLLEVNIKNYNLGAENLDWKYVCIYTKDNVNWLVTTGVSNQIKISSVEFVDDIIPWPVYYDSVNVIFNNVYEYAYTWVTNKSKCNQDDTDNAKWLKYTGRFVLNSDENNNRYMCVYAEDVNWSRRFFTSENSVNIIWHWDVISFEDWVNPNWNKWDTISIKFSGDVVFTEKKYKWVSNILECTNTGDMIDYSWDIVINHQYLNWYYLCLYTLESGSNIENYLVSPDYLKVDITPPTNPTVIYPTSWGDVSYLIIHTTWAFDADAGLAWFEYQISKDSSFMDLDDEWFITISWDYFSPKFDWKWWIYLMRIRSVDLAWNVGDERDNIDYITFNYVSWSGFEFENITGADLWKNYTSNSITIAWLTESGTIDIEITRWTLYRNWVWKGTWATVKNWDVIQIRMQSSDKFETKVTSNLILANRIIPRSITTKGWDPILMKYNISDRDKVAVDKIFASMKTMYKDYWETMELFYTMKNMLKDEIALGKDNVWRLEYLLYLIEDYLSDESNDEWKIHVAPNCKKYTVLYDSNKDAYYSPDMKISNWKKSYFADMSSLLRFIDANNIWGDCDYHIYTSKSSYKNSSSDRYIAPNGKVYDITFTNIWYTSPDLATTKYFASLSELKSYISKNNASVTLLNWDHTVDTEFEPVNYTSPNGKQYKIYHTDKWYMSYKLMSVKYFEKIEALEIYINKNNPKK